MPHPAVSDVRAWIGAREWQRSLAFYTALGCTTVWRADDDSMALLQIGEFRFYLQDYFVKDWAENTMVTVAVASARDWYEHVAATLAAGDFGDARVAEPRDEPWGATVTYVWDPSGVLLHLAQFSE